jgi:hypothetical protein
MQRCSHSGRRAGVIASPQGFGNAEKVTGIDHADDDLLAFGRHLRHAQTPGNEDEEPAGLLSLLEHNFIGGKEQALRGGKHAIDFGSVHALEQRHGLDNGTMDVRRHAAGLRG